MRNVQILEIDYEKFDNLEPVKVKDLLIDKIKWTQFTAARDSSGKITDINSNDAYSWCLRGAISKCYGEFGFTKWQSIFNYIGNDYGVVIWNDSQERTFDDVRNLIETLDI